MLTPTVLSRRPKTLKVFLLLISSSEITVVELLARLSFSAVLDAAVTSSSFCCALMLNENNITNAKNR